MSNIVNFYPPLAGFVGKLDPIYLAGHFIDDMVKTVTNAARTVSIDVVRLFIQHSQISIIKAKVGQLVATHGTS